MNLPGNDLARKELLQKSQAAKKREVACCPWLFRDQTTTEEYISFLRFPGRHEHLELWY